MLWKSQPGSKYSPEVDLHNSNGSLSGALSIAPSLLVYPDLELGTTVHDDLGVRIKLPSASIVNFTINPGGAVAGETSRFASSR